MLMATILETRITSIMTLAEDRFPGRQLSLILCRSDNDGWRWKMCDEKTSEVVMRGTGRTLYEALATEDYGSYKRRRADFMGPCCHGTPECTGLGDKHACVTTNA